MFGLLAILLTIVYYTCFTLVTIKFFRNMQKLIRVSRECFRKQFDQPNSKRPLSHKREHINFKLAKPNYLASSCPDPSNTIFKGMSECTHDIESHDLRSIFHSHEKSKAKKKPFKIASKNIIKANSKEGNLFSDRIQNKRMIFFFQKLHPSFWVIELLMDYKTPCQNEVILQIILYFFYLLLFTLIITFFRVQRDYYIGIAFAFSISISITSILSVYFLDAKVEKYLKAITSIYEFSKKLMYFGFFFIGLSTFFFINTLFLIQGDIDGFKFLAITIVPVADFIFFRIVFVGILSKIKFKKASKIDPKMNKYLIESIVTDIVHSEEKNNLDINCDLTINIGNQDPPLMKTPSLNTQLNISPNKNPVIDPELHKQDSSIFTIQRKPNSNESSIRNLTANQLNNLPLYTYSKLALYPPAKMKSPIV